MTASRRIGMVWTLALAGLMTGCMSLDRHEFISTVYVPKNIEVVNRTTGQVLFKREIPVYHKLVLDFDRQPEFEPMYANMNPATTMRYRLTHMDKGAMLEEGTVKLPGVPVMMRMTLRPAPEYPPGYVDPYAKEEEEEPAAPAPAPVPVIEAPTPAPAEASESEPQPAVEQPAPEVPGVPATPPADASVTEDPALDLE